MTDPSDLLPPLAALLEPLVQRIADLVVERLAPGTSSDDRDDGELYVTRARAKALGVETRALLRAQRSGAIEAFRPGREVLYRRSDVLALIERAKVIERPSVRCAPAPEDDPFEAAVAHAEQRRRRVP
jgi:hypothetical protein